MMLHCVKQVFFTAALLLALVAIPQAGVAQTSQGLMTGHVVDAGGASVPGATVSVKNEATGVATDAASDANGIYTLPSLVPGRYTITATAPGFKSISRAGIELHVGDKLTLDLSLPVGAVSEVV